MIQYFPVPYLQDYFPSLYFQTLPEVPVEPVPPVIPPEDISGYRIIILPSILHLSISGNSRINNTISGRSLSSKEVTTPRSVTNIISIPSTIRIVLNGNSLITNAVTGKSKTGNIDGKSVIKLDVINRSNIERKP